VYSQYIKAAKATSVTGIIMAQFTFSFFFRRRLAIALPKVAGAANMIIYAEVETKSLMTIACL
jgi:hypothetical protein